MAQRYLVLLIILFFVNGANAMEPKELFEKYKHSVVKIAVMYHGIKIKFGTGFFVSEEGHIVTNFHVIDSLDTWGYTLLVTTFDNKSFSGNQIEVGLNLGGKNIDFALLKIPFRPTIWFKYNPTFKAEIGEKIYSIGHPMGLDYTLTDGLVSGTKEIKNKNDQGQTNTSYTRVQISSPISPGNSGGPILDAAGNLVGVTTSFDGDQHAQNLNFSISGKDIWEGYDFEKSRLKTIVNYQKEQANIYKEKNDQLIKKIFDPLYVKALKGEDMSPHFERVKINVPTIGSYYIPIYSVFLPSSDHCVEKVNQGKIIYQLTCRNFRKDVTFKFFVEKSKNNALLSLEGKEAPRRPLKIVSDLIQNGTWDEVKKRLSEKQLDTLYSMPSKMKCFDGATSISEFLKNSTYCSDQTYNDHWPDSITYYHSRQLKGSDIVETFSINTRNSDAGRFYLHTSVLARLGTLFKLTNAQAQVNHQEENVNKAKTESAATNSKTTFGAAEAAAHPEQYAEKFKKYHQYQQDSAKGKDVSKVMDLLNLRISLDEKETVTDKNGNKKITKDNQYKYYFILPSTIFDIKKYKIEKEKVLQTISTTDEKLTFKVFPVTGYTKNLKELIDELAKDLSPESIIGLAAKHRVTKDNPYGCTESAKHDFCMVLIKGGKITKKFRVVTVRHYKSQHLMPVVYQIETDDEGLLSLARDLLIVADEFSSLKKVN